MRIGGRDHPVHVREADGYVDACVMCSRRGAKPWEYFASKRAVPCGFAVDLMPTADKVMLRSAQAPLEALDTVARCTGLPTGAGPEWASLTSPDLQTVVEKRGWWVHPLLGRHVAAWVFPEHLPDVRTFFEGAVDRHLLGSSQTELRVRRADGFVNGTVLGKTAGTPLTKYLFAPAMRPGHAPRTVHGVSTALPPPEFVACLSRVLGIPTGMRGRKADAYAGGPATLVQKVVDAPPQDRCTWLHPLVACHQAAFLSDHLPDAVARVLHVGATCR